MTEQLYRKNKEGNSGVILQLDDTWYNLPECVIVDLWRDLQQEEIKSGHLTEQSTKWKEWVLNFVQPDVGDVDPDTDLATMHRAWEEMDQRLVDQLKDLLKARGTHDLKAYQLH
jgi:hypothetical protein